MTQTIYLISCVFNFFGKKIVLPTPFHIKVHYLVYVNPVLRINAIYDTSFL